MRRKPRSLFKTRMRNGVLYSGPEWVGEQPHYEECIDEILKSAEGKLEPGKMYQAAIFHDGWCDHFSGGCCNCNPEVHLVDPDATPENPAKKLF